MRPLNKVETRRSLLDSPAFFMRKFLNAKKFFKKYLEKISAIDADNQKQTSSRPWGTKKNWKFSPAAVDKNVGLHF